MCRFIPLLICLPIAVFGVEWQVDKNAADNKVKFTSKVAGFAFSGVTDRIDGFIYRDEAPVFATGNRLHFEVDLASFATGIGKRDRDMRQVLDTDRWPKAVFKGEIAGHAAVDSSVAAHRLQTKGILSLHGVDRAVEVPGTWVVVDEGRARVQAAFTLELADHRIEAPSLAAFVKVSQEIALEVAFHLKQVK